VDRDVFDLRPVPPPAVTPEVAAPPPNVKFVGVISIAAPPYFLAAGGAMPFARLYLTG
jgi:hypothetical protein